jgi:hypothetical protein
MSPPTVALQAATLANTDGPTGAADSSRTRPPRAASRKWPAAAKIELLFWRPSTSRQSWPIIASARTRGWKSVGRHRGFSASRGFWSLSW